MRLNCNVVREVCANDSLKDGKVTCVILVVECNGIEFNVVCVARRETWKSIYLRHRILHSHTHYDAYSPSLSVLSLLVLEPYPRSSTRFT